MKRILVTEDDLKGLLAALDITVKQHGLQAVQHVARLELALRAAQDHIEPEQDPIEPATEAT